MRISENAATVLVVEVSEETAEYVESTYSCYLRLHRKMEGATGIKPGMHRCPGYVVLNLARAVGRLLDATPNPLVRHCVPHETRPLSLQLTTHQLVAYMRIAARMPTTGDRAAFLLECAVQLAKGEPVIATEGSTSLVTS